MIPFPSSGVSPPDSGAPGGDLENTRQNEASLSNSPASSGRGVGRPLEPPVPQAFTIPRIVVTPAPPQQSREMSSCVPVQDTCFGARLTVPAHTALNACHPPMAPPSYPYMPLYTTIRSWTYRQGHWCAVVPGLDEQERRGIFSRPINLRRRAMRKRHSYRDHLVPYYPKYVCKK